MQGFLLKKKEKLGKWKQLYFVLKQDGPDSHLYFYESPKRTKPKGLIQRFLLVSVHKHGASAVRLKMQVRCG